LTQRRAGIFHRCSGCKLNNNLCVCSSIKPLKIESHVSLIVHVRELKLTSNTAHFVNKMLPDNSRLMIRGKMNEVFNAQNVLRSEEKELFLYPHEDAVELNEDFRSKNPGPYHLIVPDGNWHQARKVRQREEALKNILAVKLPTGIMTEYKLRKAPHPEWVCTYEAVAHALGILEGSEVRDKLLTFFRSWVKTAIFNRTKDENASL
jgi:DTW domain-containing protein YfiP